MDTWGKRLFTKEKEVSTKTKESQKEAVLRRSTKHWKTKGWRKIKTIITERNDDFEMAMAMSVTEEIERVRQAENDRESEELAKVLSIALHEVSRESGGDQPSAN